MATDADNDGTDARVRQANEVQAASPGFGTDLRGGNTPRVITVRRASKPGSTNHSEVPHWTVANLHDARMKRLGGYGRSPQARRLGVIWFTKVHRVSKQLRARGQHRIRTPRLRPNAPKIIELRLRATPAQVATHIKRLSNRVLNEEKSLPFDFALPTNLRDRTIRAEFQGDTPEIAEIYVYPSDPPSAVGRLQLPDLHMGWIDLVAVGQDSKGAHWCLLTFTCPEQEWLRFIAPWNRLVDEFRRLGVVMQRPVTIPKQPLAEEASSNEAKTPLTKKRPGRKPNLDDDWAFEQIYVHKRLWGTVYREWTDKIPAKRLRGFVDPVDAFGKAMTRRYDKWEGRNMPQ